MSESTKMKKVKKGFKMVQPDLSHPSPIIQKKTETIGSGKTTRGAKGFNMVGPDLTGGGWVKGGK